MVSHCATWATDSLEADEVKLKYETTTWHKQIELLPRAACDTWMESVWHVYNFINNAHTVILQIFGGFAEIEKTPVKWKKYIERSQQHLHSTDTEI